MYFLKTKTHFPPSDFHFTSSEASKQQQQLWSGVVVIIDKSQGKKKGNKPLCLCSVVNVYVCVCVSVGDDKLSI